MKVNFTSLVLGVAIIIGGLLIANAYKYKFKSTENINVTGLAEKDFVSDQIVWKGSYSKKMMDLQSAYAALKENEVTVKDYLRGKGIKDEESVFSAVDIEKQFTSKYDTEGRNTGSEFTGYQLSQSVTIDSKEIEKIEKLSREATELIQSGIEFSSAAPAYYYTKLSELKLDLLAKASEDARLRASTIAENSKGSLGNIRRANMGIFQITGKNSNEEYSYGGTFNTSSKIKTASITVKIEYAAN